MIRTEPASSPDSTGQVREKLTWLAVGLVALLVLAAILNYVDRLCLLTLAKTLKGQFGLSGERWGWINSAFALMYIVTSLLGGAWIDRVGVRKGLTLSVAIWSLAAAGHALATGFWSLCFWRMMLAVGEGPGTAAMLKGMRRVMPAHLRDTGTGFIGAGWAAGALLGPLIVRGVLSYHEGAWQAVFLITGALGALWLPFWIVLSNRPQAGLSREAVHFTAGSDEKAQPLAWNSLALWAALLAIFFSVAPTVFMNSFFGVYLTQVFQMSDKESTRLVWQPFLATDIGQLAGGFAATLLLKRGLSYLSARRMVMVAGFCGAAVIVGANYARTAQDAIWWFNASRFCYQGAYTMLMVYAIESVADNQTALMSGLGNATFSGCNFIFNPLIGRMGDHWSKLWGDHWGYRPVINLIAVCPIIGVACWVVLSQLHHRRNARDGDGRRR